MKIIFCLNHFLPQQVAGTEIYTFSLMKELQKRHVECIALIPNYEKTINSTYWIDGIRVVQYAEPSILDRELFMGKRVPDGIKAFQEVLQAERPDIVHFQEVAGGNGLTLFHLKVAKEQGAKVVMTFHLAGYSCRTGDLMFKQQTLCDGIIDEHRCSLCFLHHKGYESISTPVAKVSAALFKVGLDTSSIPNRIGTSLSFHFLIKELRNNLLQIAAISDKVVSLTHWYYDILIKNGIDAQKLTVITQGLPLKDTSVVAKRPDKIVPLRLIFIGRITPLKGVHLLIEAFGEIDPLTVSLHIYGSTTDQQYEKQCKIASVSMPNVKWMGQLEQAQVIPTMQRYHALCLPSTFSEMSPLVIQEAFAAGIPVVASNIYGNAEQVKDGENGLLFAFNDAIALRERIMQLIQQPTLLEHLTAGILTPRSFGAVADEYQQLYFNLLSSAPSVQPLA
ncbi:MAG TPA: glycosyltransferase [Flavipsychrobacter sp.]|nr:glycosyltransferase [Flavipsychrobacter sp.]